MKIGKISYNGGNGVAILLYDISLVISDKYYFKVPDINNKEDILIKYYQYVIDGERSNDCGFDDIKDRIEFMEIETDEIDDDFGFFYNLI